MNPSFPFRLHELLDDAQRHGLESVISWLPSDRAFKVHERTLFSSGMAKRYFNQTKYKSFQRQLVRSLSQTKPAGFQAGLTRFSLCSSTSFPNAICYSRALIQNFWGFERIKSGVEKGGYHHPHFVRGCPDMCHQMVRQKVKPLSIPEGRGERTRGTLLPPSIQSTLAPTSNGRTSINVLELLLARRDPSIEVSVVQALQTSLSHYAQNVQPHQEFLQSQLAKMLDSPAPSPSISRVSTQHGTFAVFASEAARIKICEADRLLQRSSDLFAMADICDSRRMVNTLARQVNAETLPLEMQANVSILARTLGFLQPRNYL